MDGCLDTRSTVSMWQRPTVSRAVGKNPLATGQPSGARLSLVSFTNVPSVLDASEFLQDIIVVKSVATGGYNNFCSTSAGPASNQCSVNQSSSAGACSVDGYMGTSFCSAGPPGSPNGSWPILCSANNNANASSCSTNGSGTSSVNLECSVMGASSTNQVQNSYCSTQLGSGQTCSTGVNAGGGTHSNTGQTNTQCSTLGYSGGGNFCSVNGGGGATTPNQCSSDSGTTNFCSATTSTTDFCSVKAGQTHVTCTAIPSGGTMGNCSVGTGISKTRCSIQVASGGTQGDYPGELCSL